MWTSSPKVDIHTILEAYRKQECLWNTECTGYKIKRDRQIAYNNMITDLGLPELTPVDIRLKIKSIRTIYRKELSRYLRGKAEGENRLPKLAWFKQAHSFLKNVSVPTPGRWQKNDQKSENNDETNSFEPNASDDDQLVDTWPEGTESIYNEMEDPIDVYKIEINDHIENDANASAAVKKSSKTQCCGGLPQRDDEYQRFCNSVAAQLREIPDPYARSMAKFKIQQVLFEAETGQYKKESNDSISISNNI